MEKISNARVTFKELDIKRIIMFSLLILAFELFNYSTTDYAMTDHLGDSQFVGVRWATILAIFFCGIDFAAIARLFTPEQGADEPAEVRYLFYAWLLLVTINAVITWWGISVAILNHDSIGNSIISRETMINKVPIFVAVIVWLTRLILFGAISFKGEEIFCKPKGVITR